MEAAKPMSKRKSSYKGVRYIAQSLNKYFGKQYPSYKSALPKAREVFGELQSSKQKVKLSTIFPLVRKGRKGKKGAPELDPELAVPMHYFDLQRYPILITRVSNELWFTSDLYNSGEKEIRGGSLVDYQDYFSQYVNYINSLASQYPRDENRYTESWFVKCTEPVFNRYRKRWESKIISVDETGVQVDYGFSGKKTPQEAPKPPKAPTTPPKPESEPETKETGKKEVSDQEIRLVEAQTKQIEAQTEQKKQENISNLLKLFGEGQLTKAEFKELMNKIK